MYIFRIIKESLYHPEIGRYKAFGVEVYEKSTQKKLLSISDVFTDLRKAREFALLCNECQPEPVHLKELCMDFIE